MAATFNIIDYLAGLTRFTFDKVHLQRVAYDCGVADITEYSELTEEQRDNCEMELLKLIVYGPYTSSSVKNKHGDFEVQVGSYTLTSTQLESARARLKRLMTKWDLEDDLEELENSSGTIQWINETDW